jgi:DNA transposition AAA+ family ATPase
MTNLQKTELKKDVKTYLTKRGGQMELLGRKAGVGQQVINDILAERFDEVPTDYLLRINTIVKSDAMKGLYKTADCIAFMKAKENAIKHQLMIGVTGDTGTGKSYMSQAVAKAENVFYYNCHLKKSSRVFFQDLLLNMRSTSSGNISELIDKITYQIYSLDNPLIIIDEADKMYPEIRAAIHTLRDRTIDKCGWLLVGMPAFKNSLISGKEQGKAGYAEFWRRVNVWHHLGGLKPEEVKTVLLDNGITDPELQREFRKITSFGELVNEINLHKLLKDE